MMRRRRGSWQSARFLVVDTETTGLDPATDEVISFAAIPIDGGRIAAGGLVEGLVRPRRPPAAESVEIHGLLAADLESAPMAPEAITPLARALDGRTPVAHAAWVERTFLHRHLMAVGSSWPRRVADTALLFRLLWLERGEDDPGLCSLASIAGALGLPSHRPHRAEGDALTTAQAFLALATHLEAHGHRTLGALTAAERRLREWELWRPSGRT
jgi:DNA polymerase-3 subunit epsilon